MTYKELRERYPEDLGQYGPDAKTAIKGYQGRPEDEKVADAMAVICGAVNGGNVTEVAQAMYVGMSRNHRTLQNQAVHAMFEFLRIYRHTAYDLRNYSTVVAAAQVTKLVEDESIRFPYI